MTDQRRPADLTHDEAMDLAASFVLGALDDDEMAAVRAHLASCPEPHTEFRELAEAVPLLQAGVERMEPPAALKDRIMAAAGADLDARRRDATPTPAAAPEPARAAPVDLRGRRPAAWSWALGIAAVLAIALLGAWNLSLQSQLMSAQEYGRQVAAVLDAAAQPDALTAVMRSQTDDGPTGIAAVTSDGIMRVAMRDLAPTSGTEVYEAWVIEADHAPVPLGAFQVGTTGVGYLEASGLPTEPGIVLALTREPGPGATAPTTTPVSLGTAASPA
jgi:anti-sigma factor RsiW